MSDVRWLDFTFAAVVLSLVLVLAFSDEAGHAAQQSEDQTTTKRVRAALLEADPASAAAITVVTRGGMVVLNGSVADRRQKLYMLDVANRASGATEVRNNIEIDRSGAPRPQEHDLNSRM